MRMASQKNRALWVIAVLCFGLAFCGDSPNQSVAKLAPIQPNKTSELALAMRTLDSELVNVLAALGEDGSWDKAFLSALDLTELMPTDSSMLIPGYTAFAAAFGKHVKAFNERPSAEAYSAVVTGCLSCHQRACPGPIERINKRKLNYTSR
jgi:hypothetical protein